MGNLIFKGKYNSYRHLAKELNMGQSTFSKYVKSGQTFKQKYQFYLSLQDFQ